jgi:hypothetical protein
MEDLFAVAFKALELFDVLASVLLFALVELDADPLLVVARLLDPVPTVDDVAPRLVPLLLFVEAPTAEELPGLVELAPAAVEFEADVSLLVLALLAVAPNVAAAELDLLAFREPFAANAFVVALDLLALAAKLLVVEPDLLALTEAEEASLAPKVLLELSICVLLSLAVKLFISELVCELVSIKDELSLDVWLREALMLLVLELVSVSLLLLLRVSSLFCPRE